MHGLQESSRSSAAQSFVVELLQSLIQTEQPEFEELKTLLLKSFLVGLQEQQNSGEQMIAEVEHSVADHKTY